MTPTNPQELVDLVRAAKQIPVPLLTSGEGLSFAGLRGEIRHDVVDGVVSCPAGTTLRELNSVLAQDARCLPHASVWPDDADDLPLAVLVLLGLPHAAEATYGTWRDWIVGVTMVTAEGELVKSGSRVVKSVAGYDAHKLLIGSRGTLALPVDITFRTYHRSGQSYPHPVYRLGDKVQSILRVRPVDVRPACESLGDAVLFADESTGTFWTARSVQDLPNFPYAWSFDPNHPLLPEALIPLYRRTKSTLDPEGKLAPAAFLNL